jgi:predicted HAD superfamily hydrolase
MVELGSTLGRKIKKAEVVSFDVFDTAVLRKLDQPHRLFQLMLPQISKVLGDRARNFPAARGVAEWTTRMQMAEGQRYAEVRLQEIYKTVADVFGLGDTAVQELRELEIRSELAICCQNPFIYSVYRHCVDIGKKVIFLSDMYLPQRVVAEILDNCGYSKYQALLVSSESRKSKATGTLYAEVLQRTGVAPKRWLHIGDNAHSDVGRARILGIATWHYESPAAKFQRNRLNCEAWLPDRPLSPGGYVVKGMLANRLHHDPAQLGGAPKADHKFWEDFGYCSAGPLYVGLTEWLIERIAECDPDAIYFLSRDGFIIKRLFEMLRPASLRNLETHYLYASRRASQFAAIRVIDEQALNFLVQNFSVNNVGVFLKRIGLDPQEFETEIRQAGFRSVSQPVHDTDIEGLKQLFRALARPICERAEVERKIMLDYLLASGLSEGRRIALVDIGWRGHSQQSIEDMLEQSSHFPEVRGYYLGTLPFDANVGSRLWQEGYLYRLGEPGEYRDMVHSCVEIVELPFSSKEGSLIRMDRTQSGEFVPVTQAVTPMEVFRGEIVERIQSGGMHFVTDYRALKQEFPNLSLTREEATNQLRRVLRSPTLEEAARLGDVPHLKDFGDSTPGVISAPPRLLSLLGRRRLIKRHNGTWRAGVEARSSWLYRILYRLRMRELA